MQSRMKFVLAAVILAALVPANQALAGTSWICSITSVVACDEDGTIGLPDNGGLDYPTFLRVDPDSKEITLLAPESRKGEVTKIHAVHEGMGIWVLTGVEDERAWSMVIADSGYMTLSVTMDGATWTVFGNAMRED